MVPTALELPSYEKGPPDEKGDEMQGEENQTLGANEDTSQGQKEVSTPEIKTKKTENISPSILQIRSNTNRVKSLVNDLESKLGKAEDRGRSSQMLQASVLSTCSEFTTSFVREEQAEKETMNLEKLSSLIDNAASGVAPTQTPCEEEWVLEFTEDSKAYWYSTVTGESRWELPASYLLKTLSSDIDKFNSFLPFVGSLQAVIDESSGKTLLHHLAQTGFVKAIESLVVLDVDINSQDYQKRTALHYCLNCENEEARYATLKRLMSLGCATRTSDAEGNSPLHSAILSNDPSAVSWLLEHENFRLDRDFPLFNFSGDSPMHIACKLGCVEIVDSLLDIYVEDSETGSWAPMYSHVNIAQQLPESCCTKGCCVTLIKLRREVEAYKANEVELRKEVSRLRQKLLSCAKQEKDVANKSSVVAAPKLETSARIKRDGSTSSTVLTVSKDDTIKPGKPTHVGSERDCSKDENNFLHPEESTETRRAEAIDADKVSKVWSKFFENAALNKRRRVALSEAIKTLHVANVTAALSAGDAVGLSLHECCSMIAKTPKDRHNLLEIAATIIDFGADIDAVNAEGRTPLHVAAEHGNTMLVEFLLKHAAGVHRSDCDGNTALHLAAFGGTKRHLKCVHLLVKYGSSLVWCNGTGETAADRARMSMLSMANPSKALCQTVYLLQELAHHDGHKELSNSESKVGRPRKLAKRRTKPQEDDSAAKNTLNDSAWSLLPGMSFVKGATSFLLGTSILEGDEATTHAETGENEYSTDTSTLHSCIDEDEEDDFEDCSAPTPPDDLRRAIHKAKLEKSGIYSAV